MKQFLLFFKIPDAINFFYQSLTENILKEFSICIVVFINLNNQIVKRCLTSAHPCNAGGGERPRFSTGNCAAFAKAHVCLCYTLHKQNNKSLEVTSPNKQAYIRTILSNTICCSCFTFTHFEIRHLCHHRGPNPAVLVYS